MIAAPEFPPIGDREGKRKKEGERSRSNGIGLIHSATHRRIAWGCLDFQNMVLCGSQFSLRFVSVRRKEKERREEKRDEPPLDA